MRFLLRAGSTAADAIDVVRGLGAAERHEFWPDDRLFDAVDMAGVIGHRQVTDAYLAALARARGASLATLDRGLALVHGDVASLIEG